MKPLTTEFVKANGFKKEYTRHEDEFYYEQWENPNIYGGLIIFFNYFHNREATYDIELEGIDLQNVGEEELLVLLKILPKSGG